MQTYVSILLIKQDQADTYLLELSNVFRVGNTHGTLKRVLQAKRVYLTEGMMNHYPFILQSWK